MNITSDFNVLVQRLLVLGIALAIAAGAWPAFAEKPRGQSPTAVMKESTAKLQKILARKVKAGSKAEEKKKADIKATVNTFLDFAELAKRSLGKHWEARSEAERNEFVSMLRDLIETSYTNRIQENADFEVKYILEEIKDDDALVRTIATAKGKKGELHTDYRLHLKDGRWFVYDLIIEDTSLNNQYRSQFNKVIKQKGWNELIAKMKAKRDELNSTGKMSEDEPATPTQRTTPK